MNRFPTQKDHNAFTILNGRNGQMMVEYALILLLVAIVVLAMIRGLGGTNYNTYSSINSGVTSAMNP